MRRIRNKRHADSRTRFDTDGTIVIEQLLEGDKGEQLALLAPPSQTGEGLALETAGPLFEEETQ